MGSYQIIFGVRIKSNSNLTHCKKNMFAICRPCCGSSREVPPKIIIERETEAYDSTYEVAVPAEVPPAERPMRDWLRVNGFPVSGSLKTCLNTCVTEYPIFAAVREANSDLVRSMMSSGADTNVHNAQGLTPMEFAIQSCEKYRGRAGEKARNVLKTLSGF